MFVNIINKLPIVRVILLVLSATFGLTVGTAAYALINLESSDGGYIMTENGNNLLVFTPSLKPKDPYFDNGKGITIWLRMHRYELQHPYFYADLIRFYYQQYESFQMRSSGQIREPFHFQSFPLSVKNAENLVIEIIPDR